MIPEKKINATVQIDEIVKTCIEFVLYALNFERCIVLLRNENQLLFESVNIEKLDKYDILYRYLVFDSSETFSYFGTTTLWYRFLTNSRRLP